MYFSVRFIMRINFQKKPTVYVLIYFRVYNEIKYGEMSVFMTFEQPPTTIRFGVFQFF